MPDDWRGDDDGEQEPQPVGLGFECDGSASGVSERPAPGLLVPEQRWFACRHRDGSWFLVERDGRREGNGVGVVVVAANLTQQEAEAMRDRHNEGLRDA